MLTIFEVITQEINWLNSHKSQIKKNSRNTIQEDYILFSQEEMELEEINEINEINTINNYE